MRQLISLLIASAISISLFGYAASHSPSQNFTGTEIVQSEFGLFTAFDTGAAVLLPTRVVPLIPGQAYGWVIILRTNKPRISWREELTLPSEPATWSNEDPSDSRSVSTNGRVSIVETTVTPLRGVISNSWSVEPGDPKGRYVIRVFVDGALAEVFDFDVE